MMTRSNPFHGLVVLSAAAACATFSPSARADDGAPTDPDIISPAPESPPEADPPPSPEAETPPAPEPTTDILPLAPDNPPWHHGSGVVVGLKVGGAFASVFNEFGASFAPELELGWMLPFADRMLELFVSGRWSAPTTSGTAGPDARLPGDGMMSYDLKQQTAAIGLGLRLRIDAGDLVTPYVALGGRVHLTRTEVSGEAGGEPFGNNDETGTHWGFFGAAGAEFNVGPGAILLEVQLNQVSIDAWVLRDTNMSSLDVFAGYRFMF